MSGIRTLRNELFKGTRNHGTVVLDNLYLEAHQCGACGVFFAVDLEYMKARRADGETWCCPNGHPWVYNGGRPKTEILEEQLERERNRRARVQAELDQAAANLRGQKARASRFRNERDRERTKAHAGVCPVEGCQRHFTNLERHMATKHPDVDA